MKKSTSAASLFFLVFSLLIQIDVILILIFRKKKRLMKRDQGCTGRGGALELPSFFFTRETSGQRTPYM